MYCRPRHLLVAAYTTCHEKDPERWKMGAKSGPFFFWRSIDLLAEKWKNFIAKEIFLIGVRLPFHWNRSSSQAKNRQ